MVAKKSSPSNLYSSIWWTGRDQLLAPPLTGPFFIERQLEKALKDPKKMRGLRTERLNAGALSEGKDGYQDSLPLLFWLSAFV
jgi:hypothetical protein